MGPRLMSRGGDGSIGRAGSGRPGFNGAATHESRRLEHVRHEPGRVAASMGPRLMSRGGDLMTADEIATKLLQWGRDS